MKNDYFYFIIFINDILLLINFMEQNPTPDELKQAFYNYINGTRNFVNRYVQKPITRKQVWSIVL